VNGRFADVIGNRVDEESTVWFQDYHFGLAPRIVRESNPDVFQMHFFHIPWPSPDVFRICPQAEALLDGLLGNDLLGFHCSRYSAQFMNCVDQLLEESTVDWSTGTVVHKGHSTRVKNIPFGVDAEDIQNSTAAADPGSWSQFCSRHNIDTDNTVAIGVDRLDYTKGIPQRLEALERLFETRPELLGEFTYIQKGCTTRERIPAYQRLREQIEDKIHSLNDRFGTADWSPVVYSTEMFDRDVLLSMYRNSDMAVVGPLRDGMNLVAQEYVAARTDGDGVLVLSDQAGLHDVLGDAAVTVSPHDVGAFATVIREAVTMPAAERRSRMGRLREAVAANDLSTWTDRNLQAAERLLNREEPSLGGGWIGDV
jgi:trehalose 6-phosphate synthase